MSNGNGGNNCGEVTYFNGHYYITDTKDTSRKNPNGGKLGPLAVYTEEEYETRIALVKATGDVEQLFDSPEQCETLNGKEMTALGAYIGAGLLDTAVFLEDGDSVVARESISDLTREQAAPYLMMPMQDMYSTAQLTAEEAPVLVGV